ncbi:MAG: hypothetical protein DHS80DRAFT_23486 [Piptocephalis tieghemiana]|nr:MAG: hypothetical protein DHS80DRAFT_23486 [Piptocephalis tieghemiana]
MRPPPSAPQLPLSVSGSRKSKREEEEEEVSADKEETALATCSQGHTIGERSIMRIQQGARPPSQTTTTTKPLSSLFTPPFSVSTTADPGKGSSTLVPSIHHSSEVISVDPPIISPPNVSQVPVRRGRGRGRGRPLKGGEVTRASKVMILPLHHSHPSPAPEEEDGVVVEAVVGEEAEVGAEGEGQDVWETERRSCTGENLGPAHGHPLHLLLLP